MEALDHHQVTERKSKLIRNVKITLVSAALFAIFFWFTQAQDMKLAYYGGGEFWYEEELTSAGKLVITIVTSLLFGLLVAIGVAIAKNIRSRNHL